MDPRDYKMRRIKQTSVVPASPLQALCVCVCVRGGYKTVSGSKSFSILQGTAGKRPVPTLEGGGAQFSIPSYEVSSEDQSAVSRALCLEYFSCRRSPTSLIALSACEGRIPGSSTDQTSMEQNIYMHGIHGAH